MKHFGSKVAVLTFAFLLLCFLASPPGTSAEETCLLTGDFNHSGNIDPLDAIGFVDWLWRGGPGPVVLAEADTDCDCEVTPLDAMYTIDYLWRYGPAPCNSCELACWGGWVCCVQRGDFNHDGEINQTDLDLFMAWFWWPCWVDPPCCDEADLDADGIVDYYDAFLLQELLRGAYTPPPCGEPTGPPDECHHCGLP